MAIFGYTSMLNLSVMSLSFLVSLSNSHAISVMLLASGIMSIGWIMTDILMMGDGETSHFLLVTDLSSCSSA